MASTETTSTTQGAGTKICIAGAGMGGLATALALAKAGHQNIHVYEMASNLGFVGAGIQLAPNMARILDRFGVWKDIAAEAVQCADTSVREGSTDKELGHVDLAYVEATYGYPHMVGHRSSLAGSLYAGCKLEPAISFHFSSTVTDVQFSAKPSFQVTPREGSPYRETCDIFLACDGIKSPTRVDMLKELGESAEVQDTGQAAYRIMLTKEQMAHDPELLKLINSDTVTRWIGEKRHIIAYPIASHTIYNLSTAQPDTHFAAATNATYTTKGSKSKMLETYGDYCPMIHRMLDLVPDGEVCEWRLRVHAPLKTWVHNTVALVGDACHPTLPHLAQGAAQAIEDAAVLGVVLAPSRIGSSPSPEMINKALNVYEKVRKERAEALVELAAENGRAMHLGAGKAKEERDKLFAALKAGGGKGPVPDKWADADVQRMIYGHDCMKVAEEVWEQEQSSKL
ncbi:FAD/NAD(P)-binding domain-containing protein [Delitschia confertaspora ATCC 74209]|uniref:FAD/NAD(P)-binding domain-containing protein n=1 Tax=Delitschia confertaspora ATCC 74209 TaxID=1513339 RepID=A0A9P4JXF4_9PLEO|nr:FAD/NAD(P)-binding domain-containing protein [Delitschia confertaspora ATCC 74209]